MVNNKLNKQFLRFKDNEVIVGLKNGDEQEGKLISIDNYLNTVLKIEGGVRFIRGTKIAFISLKK